jgi:hypothetical protein
MLKCIGGKMFTRKIILSLFLILSTLLSGCATKEFTNLEIAIKNTPWSEPGRFDESITAVSVGQEYSIMVRVKLYTDQQSTKKYSVIITVPNSTISSPKPSGGTDYDSYDISDDLQTITYTITASKETAGLSREMAFDAIAKELGDVTIRVRILDSKGEVADDGKEFKVVKIQ